MTSEARQKITTVTRDQGFRMTITGFLSATSAIGIIWGAAKPVIVSSVSESMDTQIHQTVGEEIKPINDAFTVLLQRDINNVRKQIARLKYRQRNDNNWTVADADELANLEIELEALQQAMKQLRNGTE